MIIIGLDPGTVTGLAVWRVPTQQLAHVTSMPVHQAMPTVQWWHEANPGELLVIFEDARQRKGGFGAMDRAQAKFGAGVREGVGAAKRDAAIWDDYLRDKMIPFVAQYPRNTKVKAEMFGAITGWTKPTNEHARDAAMLVFGIDARRAEVLLATARRNAA